MRSNSQNKHIRVANPWEKVCFTALLVFLLFPLFGQIEVKTDLPTEKVILTTDRDLYLTGDVILFSARTFLNSPGNEGWSQVLYMELFNYKKEVFVQKKFRIEKGHSYGQISIPDNLNTDNYFLRAYTQYQRNFPVQDFEYKTISIVNPSSEENVISGKEEGATKKDTEETFSRENTASSFQLTPSKRVYDQREMVSLFVAPGFEGQGEIVVRKKGTSHSEVQLFHFHSENHWLENKAERSIAEANEETGSPKLDWVPEFRGVSLNGVVKNKTNGQGVPDLSCISSVIGEKTQIHLSKTDEKGNFRFHFHELFGNKDLYVGVVDEGRDDLEILINNDFHSTFPEIKAVPLQYDSTMHVLFEELYQNVQRNNLFESKLNKVSIDMLEGQEPFVLGKADRKVQVKEFIDIPTMPEVFRELVPTVSIRGRKGKRNLVIFDRQREFYHKKPLILLDNVPVNDIEQLLSLDPSDLLSIEVFNTSYYLGDNVLGGILSIRTNTSDFAGFKWKKQSVFLNYQSLEHGSVSVFPEYAEESTSSQRIPDFRTTLYWNPKLDFDASEKEISFYASDHQSVYEVNMIIYDESGEIYKGKAEFSVE